MEVPSAVVKRTVLEVPSAVIKRTVNVLCLYSTRIQIITTLLQLKLKVEQVHMNDEEM